MSDIKRIGPSAPVQAPQAKQYKQDAPTPGVTYAQVFRSPGNPEETIHAILHLTEKRLREKNPDKDQGQGRKKKDQKKKPPVDEDKVYMIASPMTESMVQPRQNGCAPTCLAMLLRKYGLVRSVLEGYQKVESLRTDGAEYFNDTGMSLEDIASYAQKAGMKARVQRGYSFLSQLEGLLRALNRGTTPIASVQLPGMGNMRHAVLIVGITQHHVTIVDPAKPEIQEVPMDLFQLEWAKEDKTQAGVGLAYIEVWAENARGEVVQQQVGWDALLEELTRDSMYFSDIARSTRKSGFAPVVQLFPDK